MGAVRKPKPRTPLSFKICEPGSLHHWTETQRVKLPNFAYKVTWFCTNCSKTIVIQTKTIGKRTFAPPKKRGA